MKSPYCEMIRAEVAKQGAIGTDPRHVEAFMREGCGTLDALSPAQFRAEVTEGLACVREGVKPSVLIRRAITNLLRHTRAA